MFVGVDIGTSGVKAVAVDLDGSVVSIARAPHDFDRPRLGWAETPPIRWWDGVCRVLTEIAGEHSISGISFSGQMHGAVLLSDADLRLAGSGPVETVYPALMWNDQRTAQQVEQIRSLLGSVEQVVRLTGSAPLAGLTAPKLLWVREHLPSLWARVRRVCLPKDYIALSLTGELASDFGDLSGSLLFDQERRCLSQVMLERLSIDPDLLPTGMESCSQIGEVTEWASDTTGVARGTPVFIGTGDNQAAALGTGVCDPGSMLVVLGTSGVVLAPSATADTSVDPTGKSHLFCDATGTADRPGRWIRTGCMLSAGGSIEWARRAIGGEMSAQDFAASAEESPPGAKGLVFLPYLTGERCPHPDPDARGAWIGLSKSHSTADLARSVLEGVVFGIAQISELLQAPGAASGSVRVTGGGARSELIRGMLASELGRRVETTQVDEGPAFGAAMLAAVGCGHGASPASLGASWVKPDTITDPAARSPAREAYEAAYDAVAPLFAKLPGASSESPIA